MLTESATHTEVLHPRAPASSSRGRQTRTAIVDAALALAAQAGLEGLSIGALADATHMSKSGVFAHFGSREELQISVLRAYHQRFRQAVFEPAMVEPRGLPRLTALFSRWLQQMVVEVDSGCIYISGAVEFDDRPGPVRDALLGLVTDWQHAMRRAIDQATAMGHLCADTDAAQLQYELHGIVLALHHDARFLRQPGVLQRAHTAFDRLLRHYRVTPHVLADRS